MMSKEMGESHQGRKNYKKESNGNFKLTSIIYEMKNSLDGLSNMKVPEERFRERETDQWKLTCLATQRGVKLESETTLGNQIFACMVRIPEGR